MRPLPRFRAKTGSVEPTPTSIVPSTHAEKERAENG